MESVPQELTRTHLGTQISPQSCRQSVYGLTRVVGTSAEIRMVEFEWESVAICAANRVKNAQIRITLFAALRFAGFAPGIRVA